MATPRIVEQYLTSQHLITELAAHAPAEGANIGPWPGVTIYRFSKPTAPIWETTEALSLCIIAQGRMAVLDRVDLRVYEPNHYLMTRRNLHFEAQILEASPEAPFLSFVVQIDPELVRKVAAELLDQGRERGEQAAWDPNLSTCVVSTLDEELLGSVLRFVRALSGASNRRVLAPLHLEEMAVRVLQREECAHMLHIAVQQAAGNPVASALTYIAAHFAKPITVDMLAQQSNLSPSAFARLFRDRTGQSPYQFVMETRLNRARELLIEGRLGVADVAHAVGYVSVSHFIKGFRIRFGTTPRGYTTQALGREFRTAGAASE
ncbi:AraC family transcriptional regulator [Mycolicibacterium mengxianglii]|uniref:AraC family transcriptional regulator n=1 Tax=Mycolicibacterium mengxianglii TaxID=2736649 RepID=UPI0018D0CC8F|nr:AraC family transcriptional regulator [Mycolicibacterium mengxianglii]